MPTSPSHAGDRASENNLLACLPSAVRVLWLPRLELVDLELGQVLYEAQGRLTHVYFPLTAIVSLGACWAMRTSSWRALAGTFASRLPCSGAASAVSLTLNRYESVATILNS